MAFSSLLIMCLSLLAPAAASSPSVMRRAAIDSNGRVKSRNRGKSELGLAAWRALRKELEAKKKDLRESSLLSTDIRRHLLWQAVREVDNKFHKKYMCAQDEGTAYGKDAMFVQGQAAYSKINVASSRECALMCAADSFADPSHKDLACKSFAYNKTAQECKFYNFAHQERSTYVQDSCCTTGPPCNLESMREEIQTHFQVELKRTTLKVPSQHVEPKVDRKAAPHGAPNVEHKVTRTKPKVGQKTAPQVEPTVERKSAPQTKHVTEKVEQKVGPHVKQVARKVEQKHVVQTKSAAEASSDMPATQPLNDHVSHQAATWTPKRKAVHWIQNHQSIAKAVGIVGVLLVAAVSLRFRGHLATSKPVKKDNMYTGLVNDDLVAQKKAAASY